MIFVKQFFFHPLLISIYKAQYDLKLRFNVQLQLLKAPLMFLTMKLVHDKMSCW